MADSSSNLDTIAASQASKEVTANALFNAMSPAAIFAYRRSTSSGLTWGYYGGNFRNASGAYVDIANSTIALTPSATNYIEVDGSGNVSVNTSAFTAGRLALYAVVTGAGSVSSYVDYRSGRQGEFKQWDRLVTTESYASTIVIDLSEGADVVRVALTGSPNIDLTGGGDGQIVTLELTQGGIGSYNVTWGAMIHFSTDLPEPVLSTAVGKMDRIAFQCMAGSPSRYDCMAFVGGF